MNPLTLSLFVTLGKANGKPCNRRDVGRIDEALLNGSADLSHGDDYCVASTTWKAPTLDGDWLQVVFTLEVEPLEGSTVSADDLVQTVEDQVGFFAPEAFEVVSITAGEPDDANLA